MKSKNKKIVIIEDEPILLKALKAELESLGFEVYASTKGEEGLEIIRKHHPDTILLDLVLPKMDGYQVLNEIKEDPKLKTIPVIVLSNLSHDENRTKAMALGAEGYYVKALTDLLDLVEKIKKIASKNK